MKTPGGSHRGSNPKTSIMRKKHCRNLLDIFPFEWMNQWVKRAKPYTISVYSYQLSRLESQGGIYRIGDITILNEDFYDSEGTGVITQESNGIFL